jgi:hypothetical protein
VALIAIYLTLFTSGLLQAGALLLAVIALARLLIWVGRLVASKLRIAHVVAFRALATGGFSLLGETATTIESRQRRKAAQAPRNTVRNALVSGGMSLLRSPEPPAEQPEPDYIHA